MVSDSLRPSVSGRRGCVALLVLVECVYGYSMYDRSNADRDVLLFHTHLTTRLGLPVDRLHPWMYVSSIGQEDEGLPKTKKSREMFQYVPRLTTSTVSSSRVVHSRLRPSLVLEEHSYDTDEINTYVMVRNGPNRRAR